MAKARMFEFVEGSSSKFWEVAIEGSVVTTRYGKIGTAGQSTDKDEGSPDKAQKLYDKLVKEKTGKGYVEKGGGKAAPAKAEKSAAPAKAAPTGNHDAAIARIAANAKKAGYTLPKGASAGAIAKAETKLGVKFPEEVVAFYSKHDGGGDDEYICSGRELLSMEGIVGQWEIWKGLLDGGDFGKNDHGDPSPGVQQKWWIKEWIPVTYDGSGNHDILDLAPAKGGTVGQILDFWHDDSPRKVVGKSFLAWLEKKKWSEEGEDDEDEDEDEDEEGGDFRRFEMEEKFWAIKLDGASHTVKFGKQGTAGQEKTKDFDDEAAAKKDYDKLVKEKTGKGYEEV